VAASGHNPACGDELSLEIEFKDNVLKDVHVDCKGCAISTASGSMLAETVKGRSCEEVAKIARMVRRMLKGEIEEPEEDLGDLSALSGVRQFPVRIKCALLAWVTLIESLDKYTEGHDGEITVSTEELSDDDG
jgi:nitrogen fixation NifU-like protein